MKFSVTLLLELVSVAPEAFEEIAATCPSVIVDIRNPTATVANLKAAAAVKLKLKDPNQFRLAALVLDDESKKNKAQILDANDTSKKCLLSTIFPSESADVAIPLYCVKAADCESCALDTLIHGGKVVDAVSLAINGSASNEPHAAKRGREEAVDGGDRSVLSPTAQALPTLPSTKPTTPQPELSGPSPSSQATRSPAPPPAPAVRVRRNRQGHIGADEQDSADDEDDDVEEDEEGWEMWDEEGEEWLDDDDGIEWADDEFGDVLELDPAEKELLTELINYPNAEATLQRIMDGQTAEVMAEIQTANPRLFQLISENGLLFTEVMEDVKIEMESGNITNSAGVLQYLRDILQRSEAFAEAARAAESAIDDDAVAEAMGEGPTSDNGRRPRRAENEAAMADALNALAGGASEARPLTEADEVKITSLVDLGVSREQAVAAYLRMGRNVERAANYLFENM